MKRLLFSIPFLVFALIAGRTSESASAQSLTLQPGSELWIEGTSTRDNWRVNATEIQGSLRTNTEAAGQLGGGTITVSSKKIVSNKSAIMDRLIHDALKVNEHPTITYELVSAEPASGGSSNAGAALQTKGRLTLAGVTRQVDMVVVGEELQGGAVRYSGSVPLKMTDYEITPPTAMFGALRTGDDVTIHFNVQFAPEG